LFVQGESSTQTFPRVISMRVIPKGPLASMLRDSSSG
jgi:hypothetical protein